MTAIRKSKKGDVFSDGAKKGTDISIPSPSKSRSSRPATLPILRPVRPLRPSGAVAVIPEKAPMSRRSTLDDSGLEERALSERLASFEDYMDDALRYFKREVKKRVRMKGSIGKEGENIEERFEELLKDFEARVEEIATRVLKKGEPSLLAAIATALKKARQFSPITAYRKRYRDLTMWVTSTEVDEFGLDRVFEERLRPFFEFFYKTWWRTETQGIQNIPSSGRVLLVANHSGTIPWDGAMIKLAVNNEHPAQRDVRYLVEDFVYYFPFMGTFMARIGGVRACQENAERLLKKDQAVAVFPEGVKGLGKLYKNRYQLQRFGRGGFISLCIKTGSPLVPVAVVGAEEIYPMIAKSELIGRLIGAPYFPITPFWPWLGVLGMIPLPSKWTILFGEPVDFSQVPEEALEDDILINHLADKVRSTIQNMLVEFLKKRKSPWSG